MSKPSQPKYNEVLKLADSLDLFVDNASDEGVDVPASLLDTLRLARAIQADIDGLLGLISSLDQRDVLKGNPIVEDYKKRRYNDLSA